MRFPDSERVIYKTNPLVEVICQVRFPRTLRIEAELPVAFQERVGDVYPKLKQVRTSGLPEPIARAIGVQQSDSSVVYEFVDSDDTWKLALTSSFVALSTVQYTRWEVFRQRLGFALDALQQIYGVTRYSRVGLRYRDLIVRSQVGMRDAPWTSCLRREVLGELALPDFAAATSIAHRQLALMLDFPSSTVRLSHGLVEAEDDNGGVEDSYLIDADFYTEAETERRDAEELLNRFNQESGRLFRWCITEALHQAMGPFSPGVGMGPSRDNPG